MLRPIVAFVLAGAILGLLISLPWGTLVGTAVGIMVAVLGVVALVLRQNQRDLREIQQAHVHEKHGT